MRALLVAALLLGSAGLARSQQAIYENFDSGVIRNFTAGSPSTTGPLYFPSTAVQYHECPQQTGMIENGMWVERTQDCQGTDYLYWYIMNSFGGWNDWNVGYWRAWMLPGETWNGSFNRFSFRFRCDYPATFYAGANAQVGTFDKDPAANTGQGESDNYHFYHNFSFNMTPFHWVWVTINDKPQHQRSVSNSWSLPPNPTRFPTYFDYMTKAYINFTPSATADWGACYFDDMIFSTRSGEPDWYVSSLTGQYTGTRYELSWMSPQAIVLTYEVRYSSASMKTNGFSSGTDGGTVRTGGGGNVGVYWASPAMSAAAGGMYVAVRPRMTLQGIAAGVPATLNMWGHRLQVGDQIQCSGLSGVAPSDFTTTVASVIDWQNVTVNQLISGAYTANTGYCEATSDTDRFTEFYIPPDPVTGPMAPIAYSVTGTTTGSASLSWTPDPAATSAAIERSITGANDWIQVGTTTGTTYTDTGLSSATAYDYRVRSVNTQGTSGPTQLAMTAVTQNDAGAPAITTASLPDGTIGQPYTASLTATGGAAPYTWSLISGTLPAGLSFSAGTISGAPSAVTMQSGASFRIKVVGADGAASSVALSVAINITFPASDSMTSTATAGNWGVNTVVSQNIIWTSQGVRSYKDAITSPYYASGWFPNDQFSQTQLAVLPATPGTKAGVLVRGGANAVRWGCVASATQVCVRTANTSGSVLTDAPCAAVAVNAGDFIRADVTGSALSCKLNGVEVVTGTVTSTSGSPGLFSDSGNAIMANWLGGPPAPPSPVLTITPTSSSVGHTLGGTPPSYQMTVGLINPGTLDQWTATSDQAWAAVSPASGSAAGTLTVSVDPTGLTPGVYTATITVSTSTAGVVGSPKTAPLTLTVYNPPDVTTADLPQAMRGNAYSIALVATDGQPNPAWDIASGALCAGLSLDAATGTIAGSPTGPQTCAFTVRATDAGGVVATHAYQLHVVNRPGVAVRGVVVRR